MEALPPKANEMLLGMRPQRNRWRACLCFEDERRATRFFLYLRHRVLRFSAMPQHWMVKQEPTAYSWEQFAEDGGTAWTGVRNFQARNNLRAMKTGDLV